MGIRKTLTSIIGATLVGISTLAGTYTLSETEQAVVSFQGQVRRVYVGSFDAASPDWQRVNNVQEWAQEKGYNNVKVYSTEGFMGSGLHFKIPFLESVHKVPDRLLEFGANPELAVTSDKRQLEMDFYSRWYVTNPLAFHLKVGNELEGNARIDDATYSVIRDEVGTVDLHEVIRTTNRDVYTLDGIVELQEVKKGRDVVQEEIVLESNAQIEDYGMELLDQRFIVLGLPDRNLESVLARMTEERQRISSLYEAQGEAEKITIEADADRQASEILAEAEKKAGVFRGEGEGEAARIYSESYEKNPEFFKFWLATRAYEETFKDARVIISSDTEFNQFLEGN